MSVAVDEETFWLGDWKVEPPLNRIVRGEEVVRIDPRNMKVLQLLASKPGEVFSQAEIEQGVWCDVIVTPNSVYQSIAQLRRALADETRASRYIETIPRRGYRAVAEITRFPKDECSSVGAHPLSPCVSIDPIRRRLLLSIGVCIILLGLLALFTIAALHRSPARLANESVRSENLPSVNTALHEEATNSEGKPSLRLLQDLAYASISQGNWRDAQDYFLQALEIERNRAGNRHPNVGRLLSELANVAIWSYDYEAAETYARNAMDSLEGLPPTHHERIVAMRQLGYALLEGGKYSEAETHLLHALELSRQAFGDTEWNTTAVLLQDLAALRHSQGRLAEAEDLARASLKLLRQMFEDETHTSQALTVLCAILLERGKYEEAKAEAKNTLSMLYPLFSQDHVYIIAARDVLAKSLIGLQEYVAAEDILRRNVQLWKRTDGMDLRAAASESALGEAVFGQGRIIEAEEYLTRASLEIDGTSAAREEQQWFREHKERLDKLRLTKAKLSGSGGFAD